MRVLRPGVIVSMIAALWLSTLSTANAQPSAPPPDVDQRVPKSASVAPEAVILDQRASVLGDEWAASVDRAVTTAGDASWFPRSGVRRKGRISVAYGGIVVRTGFDTDAWIGNMCVTASGDRAVVAYAPRTFTNKEDLAQRGAFTAIVDLNGGSVRKLPCRQASPTSTRAAVRPSRLVLTQEGTEDLGRTRLVWWTRSAEPRPQPIDVPGQLSSPVPTAQGIVAADSGAVVRVAGDGTRTVLASAKGVPYRLAADEDGGVVFVQNDSEKSSSVKRVVIPQNGRGAVTALAAGVSTDLNVHSARGGQVYITGQKSTTGVAMPSSVRFAEVPKQSEFSFDGSVAVTKVLRTHSKDPRVAPADPMSPQRVDITAVSLATKKEFTLSIAPTPGAAGGDAASPAPARRRGNPNDPADGDQRTCSVPRNDPRNQAMQPRPRQVEWAVTRRCVACLPCSARRTGRTSACPPTPRKAFSRRAPDRRRPPPGAGHARRDHAGVEPVPGRAIRGAWDNGESVDRQLLRHRLLQRHAVRRLDDRLGGGGLRLRCRADHHWNEAGREAEAE